MNNLPTQFFTIVARNYLAYAFVLGESVKTHHPEADFGIFLMDDADGAFASEIEARGFRVLTPAQIAIVDYPAFVFKYNVTEASTAVKPFVFQALFAGGAERVIYLDPDIRCFRRLTELLDALNHYSIVLTPHSLSPVGEGCIPDDFAFLEAGAYNLGFLAVRAGGVAKRFLAWWSSRLFDWCLVLKEMNLFVDQKWMDLTPAYFDEVLILKSMAYNIAYWNFHERRLQQAGETLTVLPSGEPVAFIHFSGIDVKNLEQVTHNAYKDHFDLFARRGRRPVTLTERPDLAAPYHEYARLLAQADHARFSALPYAYGAYANGEKISGLERILFWSLTRRPAVAALPFAVGPRSFHQASRAAGIRPGAGAGSQMVGAPMAGGEQPLSRGVRLLIGLIHLALRLLVRTMTPDRYVQFAQYLRKQLLPENQRFLLKD